MKPHAQENVKSSNISWLDKQWCFQEKHRALLPIDIHSSNWYLLLIFITRVSIVSRCGDLVVDTTDKNLCPQETYILAVRKQIK